MNKRRRHLAKRRRRIERLRHRVQEPWLYAGPNGRGETRLNWRVVRWQAEEELHRLGVEAYE